MTGAHRALWLDGWKAVSRHKPGAAYDDDVWELYHLDSDFSECTDLAGQQPQRLQQMVALWWQESERHGVLPLDDRGAADLFRSSRRPDMPTARRRFVYYPPVSHIASDTCPSAARSWRTVVDITHPTGHADGALVARGTINSGFVLYVHEGRLQFDYNCFHVHTLAVANAPISPGDHRLTLDVHRLPDGDAEVTLSVDAVVVAQAHIPRLLFVLSSIGMDLGRSLSPVNDTYQAPFNYPGHIHRIVFELEDKATRGETKAAMRAEMTRQ